MCGRGRLARAYVDTAPSEGGQVDHLFVSDPKAEPGSMNQNSKQVGTNPNQDARKLFEYLIKNLEVGVAFAFRR